jgi:hypothetical protein
MCEFKVERQLRYKKECSEERYNKSAFEQKRCRYLAAAGALRGREPTWNF